MSATLLADLGVGVMGFGAGIVYVIGFTLLHQSVDDELRGRIFSTLITLVRTCVLIALMIGPALGRLPDVTPYVLGVRLALWIAGGIVILASFFTAKTLRLGVRDGLDLLRNNEDVPHGTQLIEDAFQPGKRATTTATKPPADTTEQERSAP